MTLKGKFIILTKQKALKYGGGLHPNGINLGDKIKGYAIDEPEEGVQWYLYPTLLTELGPSGWTSVVQNIDYEKMELTTMNSVYKIEIA